MVTPGELATVPIATNRSGETRSPPAVVMSSASPVGLRSPRLAAAPLPVDTGGHPRRLAVANAMPASFSNRVRVVSVVLIMMLAGLPQTDAMAASAASCSMPSYEQNDFELRTEADLKAAERARAAAELRAPDYSLIPSGGDLVVIVKRLTIGAANPMYAELVIVKDGAVILRHAGRDRIANTPGSDRLWWSLLRVDLPADLAPPYELRVADKLSSGGWCQVILGDDSVLRTESEHARYEKKQVRIQKKAAKRAAKK